MSHHRFAKVINTFEQLPAAAGVRFRQIGRKIKEKNKKMQMDTTFFPPQLKVLLPSDCGQAGGVEIFLCPKPGQMADLQRQVAALLREL